MTTSDIIYQRLATAIFINILCCCAHEKQQKLLESAVTHCALVISSFVSSSPRLGIIGVKQTGRSMDSETHAQTQTYAKIQKPKTKEGAIYCRVLSAKQKETNPNHAIHVPSLQGHRIRADRPRRHGQRSCGAHRDHLARCGVELADPRGANGVHCLLPGRLCRRARQECNRGAR